VIVAVCDTNVLAPALRGVGNPDNRLGDVLRQWRAGHFQLVVSQPILDELRRTLANPYFARFLTADQQVRALALLQRRALVITITVRVHGVATHPEDDLILATAASAKADYLVTGDEKLLRLGSFHGVRIVTPRAFLDVLARQ
jgi:putative PIN family toxin of toxin-antitoxin system